jgi:hypothetical protein
MKNSLKAQLNFLIKSRGEISYQEIKEKCESGYFGKYYRITTAERRLRHSESPEVEAVEKNGYIISYKSKNPMQFRKVAVKDEYGNVEKYITLPV